MQAWEPTNYIVNGYNFTKPDLEIMLFSGVREDEIPMLSTLRDPNAKAEPGFLVDEYGIRTRVTSLWPDARALDGLKLGFPFPGNFHWEAIEWVGLMRAVLEAGTSFRIMELGAGWGPAVVSSSVLARLRGITDIRMTAVEGDPHHFRFLNQHIRDNGFDPGRQRLHQAAVAVEKGEAQWPVTEDSSGDYGFRPITEGGDYMARQFAATRPVKLLAMRDLVRSEDRWDLIHIDVQGAEGAICADALPELNARAKRVMIGTHSRKLDGDLFELFANAGWVLENEKPCKFTFWPNHASFEAMTTVDGTQTWMNPNV